MIPRVRQPLRVAFFLPAAAWLISSISGTPAGAAVVTGSWKAQAGSCTMVLEEEDRSTYHLRVLQVQKKIGTPCIPPAQAFTDAFNQVMRDADPFRKQGKETIPIFLGRLVELPEMSRELSSTARQAREWNLASGKPVRGDVNVFVARAAGGGDGDGRRAARRCLRQNASSIEALPSREMVTRWKRGASYPSKRVPYDCLLRVDVAPAP